MKSRLCGLALILICISLALPLNAADEKIAKIDMALAAMLHPKMALFDFQTLGFYKTPIGLNKTQRDKAMRKLVLEAPDLSSEIAQKNRDYEAVMQESRALFDAYLYDFTSTRINITGKRKELEKKAAEISREIAELTYRQNFPAYTPPSETRKIIAEIENEILEIIETVVKKEGFTAVLNNSVPYVPSQLSDDDRLQGYTQQRGLPFLNNSFYEAFLSEPEGTVNLEKSEAAQEPAANQLIYWIGMISQPETASKLNLFPYPLVISGGTDILPEVLKTLYTRYGIKDEKYESALSVLKLLNPMQSGNKLTVPVNLLQD